MRRHRFETYLDKVFDFSAKVEALPDGRKSPRHHGNKIFDAVFLGAACQFPALHRIETECKGGALSKRIGSLSEDAIGYALERQDPGAVFALGCDLARQLKRNGIFRSDWSRGLVVAAIDGMEICSSFSRSCDHCMERKVTHMVDGELREELQYYHRICAVTVVSSTFPIPSELSRTQTNARDPLSPEQRGSRQLEVLAATWALPEGFLPASLTPSSFGVSLRFMKVGPFLLTLLRLVLTKVRELLNRPTDVHYTSVPYWRPWRDF